MDINRILEGESEGEGRKEQWFLVLVRIGRLSRKSATYRYIYTHSTISRKKSGFAVKGLGRLVRVLTALSDLGLFWFLSFLNLLGIVRLFSFFWFLAILSILWFFILVRIFTPTFLAFLLWVVFVFPMVTTLSKTFGGSDITLAQTIAAFTRIPVVLSRL